MTDRVSVTIKDGIADVRLNRPEKMNAIDSAMFEGLVDAGLQVSSNTTVRAVVLSGEGRAFCAGLDFGMFQILAGMGDRDEGSDSDDMFEPHGGSLANIGQRAAFIFQEIPVPVIAAIHGVAYGGGLQIALGADIRYIAPDARMSIMEIRYGLVPDMSGTQTMRHVLRLDVLKELTFTGRIVEGAQAVELGLATRLSESPYDDAMAAARDIAGKSPDAIRTAKQLLNVAVQCDLAEGLRREAMLQKGLIGRPNQIEAVMANFENRAPNFDDPS
jgi:enoyl-CoA hydratase/carnithine racemase